MLSTQYIFDLLQVDIAAGFITDYIFRSEFGSLGTLWRLCCAKEREVRLKFSFNF